jgi:N-acetylglutamate synthase
MTDLALVRRLESAAVRAWPAGRRVRTADGWLLRATPRLDRLRSNNALTPARRLADAELAGAIERARRFAVAEGIAAGIQLSPAALHLPLDRELDRQGWRLRSPAVVMVARPVASPPPDRGGGRRLRLGDRADRAWLDAWAKCDPGQDAAAHASTVFAALAGRAAFARIGTEAVAIAVPDGGLVGLFCMAVEPSRRRQGLGSALLSGLLARRDAPIAYLQVEADNSAARAIYARSGFVEAYGYAHRVATG